jgi:hypothetical protein
MRPLFISALTATLMGCTCFTPQQAQQGSEGVTKTEKAIAAKKENHRHHRKVDAKSTIAAKMETPHSSQQFDPVIKKAKATIAAMMEIPASVEFVEMKRADRKNALGKSLDTICGYVRGKMASGGETGDRPFLYLVQEDEAYIGVYILTSEYPNICN